MQTPDVLKRKARMFHLLAKHEELHEKGEHHSHADATEMDALLAADPEFQLMRTGRIPMHPAEHAAVDELQAKHGIPMLLTRRDPGNTGPLLVHVTDGSASYVVAEDGTVKKARA